MRNKEIFVLNRLIDGPLLWILLPLLSATSLIIANYFVFVVVPNERVMGPVQRIFYFHVGAAFASYFMIALLLLGSAFYLVTRKIDWDLLAKAGASVAFIFSSIVLASGMIWGHTAWNTWWRWEPRLVSFLVLWLILLSYILLRSFSEDHPRQRNFAAVLGIVAAINVPIVIFSIKFLDHREQLHPEVVAKQGLRDGNFIAALIMGIIAVILLAIWLFYLRFNQLRLEQRLVEISRESELTTHRVEF